MIDRYDVIPSSPHVTRFIGKKVISFIDGRLDISDMLILDFPGYKRKVSFRRRTLSPRTIGLINKETICPNKSIYPIEQGLTRSRIKPQPKAMIFSCSSKQPLPPPQISLQILRNRQIRNWIGPQFQNLRERFRQRHRRYLSYRRLVRHPQPP